MPNLHLPYKFRSTDSQKEPIENEDFPVSSQPMRTVLVLYANEQAELPVTDR